MSTLQSFLSQKDPFRGLPPAEIERLVSSARRVEHRKGDTVFSEGDDAASVWGLDDGRLEILKYMSDGKPLLLPGIR